MRKIIIRKTEHIQPFNEPARALHVLNKPLWQHQRDLLAPHTSDEQVIDDFRNVMREPVEMLVHSDNLYFNEAFIDAFINEAKKRRKPARAAFRATDTAYLQQGLKVLSRSYEARGDIFFVDLWYFPQGPADHVEPIIIESNAVGMHYYSIPDRSPSGQQELIWQIPERVVCAVDSWMHLFFANVPFGVAAAPTDPASRSTTSPLQALVGRRPFQSSSANVTLGENCSIDPTAILNGRVIVGDNVVIGPGCVISGCLIGDNVTLAHGNRLYMTALGEHCFFPGGASAYFSVFMQGSTAGQNATLEMSVVGRHSYIGAGAIFTNYNLMSDPIRLSVDYAQVEVPIPVLGGCVGHNCRIGSGLVVYPGRTIESDVVLFQSPNRQVIMNDILYEESDHHALYDSAAHPRQYPREHENEANTRW